MTDEPKTTISRNTYLQALGLFTLAATHMRKVEDAQKALAELLGLTFNDTDGHIGDAIYAIGGPAGPQDFDEALKRSDILVEDAPPPAA